MKESNEIVENYVRSLQPDITDAEMEVLVNDFFENNNSIATSKNKEVHSIKVDEELEKVPLVLEKNFYLFLKNKIDEKEKLENKEIAFLEDENFNEINFAKTNLKENVVEEKNKVQLKVEKNIKRKEQIIVQSKKNKAFNLFGSFLGIAAFFLFIGLISSVGYGLYNFYKISNSSVEKNNLLEKLYSQKDTIIENKNPDSGIDKRTKVEENKVNLKGDTEIALRKNDTIFKVKKSDKLVVEKKVQSANESKKILTKLSNVHNTKNSKDENNLEAVNIQPIKISKLAEVNEPSEKLEAIKIVKKPNLGIEKKSKIIFSKYE